MIRKALVILAAIAFSATAANAAGFGVNGAVASKDKLTTTAHPGAMHYSPATPPPRKLKPIFDNIGFLYPKGLYFCCYGDTVSGPTSAIGSTVWTAQQFTPSGDGTVKLMEAAVGHIDGANHVVMNIAEDDGGVPGDVIGSAVATGLGEFGDCCTLAQANVNIKLTGGTTYWFYLSTDDQSSDSWLAWPFNSTDETTPVSVAQYNGTAWTNFGPGAPAMSFALYGKTKD